MQRRNFSSFKIGVAALGCAALLDGNAQGAELGELSVHSFIDQPLVADIELTALAPDEVTGLQVRLASPDVYRGANSAMNPALASLQLSLMRHDDQRQFLHLSSLRAVEANHLLLFLTLSAGGRSAVRSATLWLSPDPRPAAPSLAPAAALAAPPTARVEIGGGQDFPVPPAAALAALAPGVASRHVPLMLPGRFRALPARACTPQASEQVQACAELDIRSAVLGSKIVDLEEKVSRLQVAFRSSAELAPASAPAPIKVGASHGAPANNLHPAQTADTSSDLLAWSAGVAALLIAVSGIFLFLRRKNSKASLQPSRYWVLLRWPFRRKARAAQPSAAE